MLAHVLSVQVLSSTCFRSTRSHISNHPLVHMFQVQVFIPSTSFSRPPQQYVSCFSIHVSGPSVHMFQVHSSTYFRSFICAHVSSPIVHSFTVLPLVRDRPSHPHVSGPFVHMFQVHSSIYLETFTRLHVSDPNVHTFQIPPILQ